MLEFISTAWKTSLREDFPLNDRVYIDFRQEVYPAYEENDITYNTIASGDNKPGQYNLIIGDTASDFTTLKELPSKLTMRLEVKPQFEYDTGSFHYLFRWYSDAGNYLDIAYSPTSDKFFTAWLNGGTARYSYSQLFDSDNNTNRWITIDIVLDLTTGDSTGSALYIDRVLKDSTWTGLSDEWIGGINALRVGSRYDGTLNADAYYNHMIVIPDYLASATDVSNNYKNVKDEQIYWDFNGTTLGRTRCNVTDHVTSVSANRIVSDPDTGSFISNDANVMVNSVEGEFADDQYAAFDPANSVYNGTAGQRYMTKRCPIQIETWYGDEYETYFNGRVENGFYRTSTISDISRVNLNCLDKTADVAHTFVEKGQFWEDKKLADNTEANSLVHLITRLATQKKVDNYVSNSSFENTTIGNSWAASGGTLARNATPRGPVVGTYVGNLVNDTASEHTVSQVITFLGDKKLNVNETYNFSIYLSGDTSGAEIRLEEQDISGTNGTSTNTYSLTGYDGYYKYEVSHTIGDSNSDRLGVYIEVPAGDSMSFDAAMLVQNNRAYNWFVLNTNDGSSGVTTGDSAVEGGYDTCGFDVDSINITHPWARVDKDINIWEYVKQLADACIAYRCGFDECGVFTFKAYLATGFTDPASSETLTDTIDISTGIPIQANKIIVHGVKILKDDYIRPAWNAVASGLFDQKQGYPMYQGVADGDDFPDSDDYPSFLAKYGEVD